MHLLSLKFQTSPFYRVLPLPQLFDTKDQFHNRQFFHGLEGTGFGGLVSGWFRSITFTVYFISITITSAPPEITKH